MREIKFRAWDKDKEKMRYPNLIGRYVISYTCWWNDDDDGSGHLDTSKLMQYTGLKDKNGKEVYEGDILRWKNDFHIFVVEWIDAFARFGYRNTLVDYCDPEYRDFARDDYVVIGNIHEHPHLLEEANTHAQDT